MMDTYLTYAPFPSRVTRYVNGSLLQTFADYDLVARLVESTPVALGPTGHHDFPGFTGPFVTG